MENKKPVKDPYRSALKKKAMVYMPKNYEDVTAQKQILAMVVAVVPAAASVAKAAETGIWPKVQTKALPIVQAVGQCAMSVDKVIAAAPMESLLLEKRSNETLMKAWVALEYYSYLMLPEYSVNIRALRDRMFAIMRQRDTGAAPARVQGRPAHPAAGNRSTPQPPRPRPVPQPPVGMAEDPNKTVMVERKPDMFQAEDPNKTVMVERKPDMFQAEDPNKTVMVERKPDMFQAEDPNKTVMVERKPEMFQAEDINKTVSVSQEPAVPQEVEKTQFTPAPEQNGFAEAEDVGSTVSVQRDQPAGKAKKNRSKAPIAIVAAALVVVAVVVGILASGSKAVEKAEEAIGAIGTVTLESGEKIEAAEELYGDLSKGNQKKVENRDVLYAARQEYDRMEKAISEVQEAIDAIGASVTLDSGAAISKARKLYDALDNELKAFVSNYSDLETKEASYTALYAEDQAAKLYTAAKSSFSSGDYNTAISKINQILDKYPGTSVEMAAKTLGSEIVEISALAAMNENRLEEAMIQLRRAQEDYVSTQEIRDLKDRLTKKLEGMRPANGKMFAVKTEQGYCKMVITAKGADLCIKLTSTSDPEKYTFYYIREGEEFAMHVKDGMYTLKYAFGDYWYGQEELFGEDGQYRIMNQIFELNTIHSGGWVNYEYYKFTLDVNGDWKEATITRDQF